MRNPGNSALRFYKDEGGASAAEYALILAVVTTGIAAATLALGDVISTAISGELSCISNPTTANCD